MIVSAASTVNTTNKKNQEEGGVPEDKYRFDTLQKKIRGLFADCVLISKPNSWCYTSFLTQGATM
jgi:hypothetical protein